jgi:hypothetical protein
MFRYIIRYSMPGTDTIEVIVFVADDYMEAEERFKASNPDAILVNIEEQDAAHH